MEWYLGGLKCPFAIWARNGCDWPAPPKRQSDSSTGHPDRRKTPMTRRAPGHSAIPLDQLALFTEEGDRLSCAEGNLHSDGTKLCRKSYARGSGLDSATTRAGSLRERPSDCDRPEEPGSPGSAFAPPATEILAVLKAPVQALGGDRQAAHEEDDLLVDATTAGFGATDRDLCASPRGTTDVLADADQACAAAACIQESLPPVSGAGTGSRAHSAAAPVPGDGHDHDIAVSTDMPAPSARRPHGYDRALERVRRAELAIRDDETAGERALVAHNHALLVALRMGTRAGRSLTRVASDAGTSASHLSRLQGCRRLVLEYARPLDMSPAQCQERYPISCVSHLLGKDPEIQRRGMHMLAVGPCSARAMSDFVRVERAASGSRPDIRPAELGKLARDAINKGQVITVRTSGAYDPEHALVIIRVLLPLSRSEISRALPRGNGTRHRGRTA